jgi:hypothetical protein
VGVRVPPLELDGFRKGKPMGDGTRLETGRDHPSGGARSLEGSTPSSSAASFRRAPRAPGRAVRPQSSKLDRRVQLPRGTLGNRLIGRLPDFESGGGGSNPPSRTWTELNLFCPNQETRNIPGQLRLVVTPRSERGGRWFDSSPRNLTASQH